MSRQLETGCLVIGSGIAGLSTAVALGERGLPVTVMTAASALTETNTGWAQGGIIFEKTGRPRKLEEDIFAAGAGVNYPPAVRQLVDKGPELVQRVLIDKAKVAFDRDENGDLRFTREGGHSESRILFRGDESGKSIEESLLAYCQTLPTVRLLTRTTAVNLLMTSFHSRSPAGRHEAARCFGAFVFDQTTREVYPIFADDTVIATGGVGQLYLHSTNSKYARGDGIALAHRAGCRLSALEYLQFHPTTFYAPGSRRFLISEALRGEGAVLVTQAGDPFLGNYLPAAAYPVPELAPRDKVAKAIHEEMLSTGAPCVYLDISHKPVEWIRDRFPFVYRSCLDAGVDITKEPIPVVPAAHYHCGGIWTDLEGRTSLPRLWAAGEAACTGLHGANRLASTSLLEGLVWGTRAGDAIAKAERIAVKPDIEPWEQSHAQVDPSFLKQDWLTLKHTMWNYVGLIKTGARLDRADGILNELARGIEVFYRNAVLSDELIGLRHASLASMLILEACRRNRKSLGCYVREEFDI